MLHIGADSFATHIASGFKKKIVCIYSNNYAQAVRPYFGDSNQHVLIEPDRTERKPSFSAEENPKSINEIPPSIVTGKQFSF